MNSGTVTERDSIEEILTQIWREVILIPDVDRNDNFFDIGGHSLLATQVLARISRAFNVDLPLRVVFESPTIAELADAVTRAQREHTGTSAAIPRRTSEGEIHRLLERLDTLSDEELQEILQDPGVKALLS
jgi:acyl carrier protein